MKSKIVVLGLLVILLTGVLAPSFGSRASAATYVAPVASSVQTHGAFFDKTRFVLHLGAAYYAFHHFIYARYKNGGFAAGAKGRTLNFVKAAIAALFTYHEVKVALGIANNSNSALLHKLVTPLNALGTEFSNLGAKLKGGTATGSDFTSINNQANLFQSQANSNGAGFNDVTVPVPGAA